MPNGYFSNGIFLGGPSSGADLNPWPFGPKTNPWPFGAQHNPWPFGPHQNPWPFGANHNPWPFGPHQNPWPFGSQHNPDPRIGGHRSARPVGLSPDPMASGQTVSQRRSLQYDPATQSPWPWRDFDPAWTYAEGGAALLPQALRKVQARLVGERDVRHRRDTRGKAASRAGVAVPAGAAAAADDPLWRWASEFRQQAVVGELLGRVRVAGGTVQLLGMPKAGVKGTGGHLPLHTLIEIEAPPVDLDYGNQIDKTLRAAIEREERLPEILTQTQDFRPFFHALTGLDRAPVPVTDELLMVAWGWATHVVMMLKNNLAQDRPVQRSSLVMPIIATPGHGSLPSGHATIAMLTAELLCALLAYPADDERRTRLQRLAARIAFNRVVAGVHFPMDGFVGRELGSALARAFIGLAGSGAVAPSAAKVTVTADSQWAEHDVADLPVGASMRPGAQSSLQALWNAASEEIRRVRV